MVLYFFFFFFKQKTAYEMRISDWSSDVCSSDLRAQLEAQLAVQSLRENFMAAAMMTLLTALGTGYLALRQHRAGAVRKRVASFALVAGVRSEGRRVGKEWVSPCSSRWSTST